MRQFNFYHLGPHLNSRTDDSVRELTCTL